ncbi:phage baseplate assembly protein domain-containing protein [Thalassospira lucentensis]|uniref:phage baseplate assembly protein domain-containing protein n=1 Tax=Thalassospira lucentensis TaxID=168935 RepID=UPI003D2DBC33
MFDTLFERLARRVENMLFRAVVRRVRFTEGQGAIIAQVSGRSGETPDDVLIMQPYGFDHFPLPVEGGGRGAEMIALQLERNLVVGLPPMDRRHRPKSGVSDAGEVGIYDDQGQRFTLKRGKQAVLETDILRVVATQKIIFETPLGEFTQDVDIGGKLTVGGDITDQTVTGNTQTVAGMRSVYNGHDHAENDNGGPTSTPNQEM